MTVTAARHYNRRRTAAQFTAENPVLAAAEFGVETDTLKVKVADGVTAWNGLDYIGEPYTDAAIAALPELATSHPAKVPISTTGGVTTLNVEKTVPEAARRTSNLTRNNTATLADDTQLFVAVAANAVYKVDAYLIYTSSVNADIIVGWTGPSGATFDWVTGGFPTTASASAIDGVIRRQNLSLAQSQGIGGVGTAGSDDRVAMPSGVLVTSTTAGNLTLQWAQGAPEVSDTTLLANSVLIAQRIA
jgi:hypothetical protein